MHHYDNSIIKSIIITWCEPNLFLHTNVLMSLDLPVKLISFDRS